MRRICPNCLSTTPFEHRPRKSPFFLGSRNCFHKSHHFWGANLLVSFRECNESFLVTCVMILCFLIQNQLDKQINMTKPGFPLPPNFANQHSVPCSITRFFWLVRTTPTLLQPFACHLVGKNGHPLIICSSLSKAQLLESSKTVSTQDSTMSHLRRVHHVPSLWHHHLMGHLYSLHPLFKRCHYVMTTLPPIAPCFSGIGEKVCQGNDPLRDTRPFFHEKPMNSGTQMLDVWNIYLLYIYHKFEPFM